MLNIYKTYSKSHINIVYCTEQPERNIKISTPVSDWELFYQIFTEIYETVNFVSTIACFFDTIFWDETIIAKLFQEMSSVRLIKLTIL